MEKVTKGCKNVEYLHTEDYLSQGQSRNMLIERTQDDYLCLTENDVSVEDDWLSYLLSACEDSPGSVAVPHIMEGPEPLGPAHFDWRLHKWKEIQGPDGVQFDIVERTSWEDYEPGKFVRRREDFIETHCVLWDMKAFEKFGRFETDTNTREEVDVSLRLHLAEIPMWFEPKSHVHFLTVGDFTIEPEEEEFFKKKWDLERAVWTHQYLEEKLKLVELPTSIPFVKSRLAKVA
jgi:GT2 family glycosyltransferase